MTWHNKGAPVLFPWNLDLALADEQGSIVARTTTNVDIRKWLPGTAVGSHLWTAAADPGSYTLLVAIIDPETVEPGVVWPLQDAAPTAGTAEYGRNQIIQTSRRVRWSAKNCSDRCGQRSLRTAPGQRPD